MERNETAELLARDGRAYTVRRLEAADADALKRFNAELSTSSRRFFLPHPYDDDTLARALERSEAGDDLLLGLFDADRVIGYFFLWYYTRPIPLLGIGLVDDFHGQGLGREMMRFLIEEASTAGRDGIELTTMTDNDGAFQLYRKMGFEHYKNVDNLQGTGQWVVERAMFYRIKADAQPGNESHQPPVGV